ncbi:MAG: PA14 domain-containing protein, partial [Bacteroidota bacterium]
IYPIENAFISGGLFLDRKAELIIKNVHDEGVVRFSLNGLDPDTTSSVYQGPVEINSTTVVKAAIFDRNKKISEVSTAYFRTLTGEANKKGVEFSYFNIDKVKEIPKLSSLKPLKKGFIHEFNLSEINFPEKDYVAVRLRSKIKIEYPGEYIFYVASDDGSKLYIDQKNIVNNDGAHGVLERSGRTNLEVGFHDLEIEWFNAEGGYFLAAFYKGPNTPKQLLPADVLYLPN